MDELLTRRCFEIHRCTLATTAALSNVNISACLVLRKISTAVGRRRCRRGYTAATWSYNLHAVNS